MNTLKKNLTLSFLILSTLFLSYQQSQAQCHIDDWTALKAIYESTDGDNWVNNTGWEAIAGNTPSGNCNLANLYGITLDEDGSVEEILLENNNLIGSIPAEIGNLDNLKDLVLDDNQLSGNIPPEFGNIIELEKLSLANNSLSGSIPSAIGSILFLTELYLNNNQLTGNIPAEIGDIPTLFLLRINDNNLSGCYDENLSNLCALYYTSFDYNINDGNNFDADWGDFCATDVGTCTDCSNACAPCHIDDWTALKAIYESTDGDNWRTNTGWEIIATNNPTANCDLSLLAGVKLDATGRVSELNLGNNWLNGSIPSEIDKLTNLLRLKLGENTFNNIPPELGNLTNLVELRLNDCGLTSNIPPALGNLSNMILLSIGNNQLSGNIPTELGNLTNMTRLLLRNNNLSGIIPPELSNASSLGILHLGANELSGSIPGELGNLNNLNWLDVSDNNLSGCFDPNLLSLCSRLTNGGFDPVNDIDWSNNFNARWENFCATNSGICASCSNGCASCHIDDWTALKALYESTDGDNWVNNTGWEEVTGNTPSSNCDLANLYGITLDEDGRVLEILLENNNLIGSIPAEIGNLDNLEDLDLNDNQLSGNIPPELGNLDNLWELSLANNNLSGNIPSAIGNILFLKELYLNNNQFTGNIPAEIGDIPSLFLMDLSDNNLSGCYDENLSSICDLYYIFDYNISYGNNFDADWEDFCTTGIGTCTDCSNGCAFCHIDDWTALKALYESTDGDNWINNTGWEEVTGNTPSANCDLANLYGITLAPNNRVIIVNLASNNLIGTIPSEVGNLQSLRDLSINNNQLSSSIPAEIGNLTSLISLQLYDNNLTGPVPAELGNLSSIYSLDIGYNNLSGCYDDNLKNLCRDFNYYNIYISNGNNFDADWEDFCTSDAGMCLPCPSDLIITTTTPFQNEYKSGNTIITDGSVIIDNAQQVEYKSNRVTLNKGFSVQSGAQFRATYGGCD